MAVNLLDLAKTYLSDGLLSQVSTMLGEKQVDTKKAFDGALPAILGGLIQKSSEPGGTSSIMDMVGNVMAPDRTAGGLITPVDGVSGNLGSILSDGLQSSRLLSMGSTIIRTLFGDNAGSIAGALSSYSGLKQSSSSTLMNIAGPLLLSVLSKKMATDNLGVSGVDSLLSSQSTHVSAAVPSGFSSLLSSIPGLGALGLWGSKLSGMTTPEPVVPVSVPASTVRPIKPAPVYQEPVPENKNSWLPWLLLLLGGAALFFVLRSCGTDKTSSTTATADSLSASMNDAATTVGAAADSAGSAMGAAADSAGSAFSDAKAKLGAFFKRKLPSGLELNIPEFGIENNLVKFIEDKSKPVDKTTWFNFDRLLFDTGKATLRPESQEQLTNVAAILKDFSSVNIKLGGYTDNTGSAALNQKLSQERAVSVMNELVRMGIDKSRLEAEGYGQEFPVASNDTEAGRAENRRIAIRVTKK